MEFYKIPYKKACSLTKGSWDFSHFERSASPSSVHFYIKTTVYFVSFLYTGIWVFPKVFDIVPYPHMGI